MQVCAIMDIDNVYTDSRTWEKHIPQVKNRQEWDKYYEKRYLSKPNHPMVELAKKIQKVMPILFVTSREDVGPMRNFSINEIEKYSNNEIKIGNRNKLFMRKKDDLRPSGVVKEDILKQDIFSKGYLPILAIDDSVENIEMFKKNGVGTRLYTLA